MKNFKIFSFITIISLCHVSLAHYSGPFLLWGVENLNNLKLPALQAIDDQVLRDIYSSASSIVIFIRNSTTKLNYENFPELSDIISKNEWLYLPQDSLTSDPLEYNVNAEVFTLTGPVQQQDNEIAAFYRDAQMNFDNKNVLGILATRNENYEHLIAKREAVTPTEPSDVSSTTSSDEPPVENFIYAPANGRGLLITSEAPLLTIGKNPPIELKVHKLVTTDDRPNDGIFRLSVKFVVPEKTIFIRFIFSYSGGSWKLNQAEYEDPPNSKTLEFIGTQPPSAPQNFSFACADTFVYRKDNITLTLKNIQVEPRLDGTNRFSRVYECVGFMSPAILSGIFVTALLGLVLAIAITAILDIKPPNRFESRNSKPLTFTVQE